MSQTMKRHNDAQSLAQGLSYDKDLNVATANTRDAATWRNQQMPLSEFAAKLAKTQRSHESLDAYMAMSKSEQDELKDVGGFVGGLLKQGRRSKESVANRSMMTLDADYADATTIDKIRQVLGQYAYTIYTTRKHTQSRPRLRLVVYPDRPMHADEYGAAMRKVAEMVGIDYFDDTTYDVNRLMYWPSTSADGEFLFEHNDAPFLSVEVVLAKYDDWQDVTQWPTSQRETKRLHRHLEKQADPLTKKGIVGAFCRTVSIYKAIEITGLYLHEGGERYTFTEGSTAKGMIVYDGKFAYSNHDTDPASRQTVNAFDLLRLHKFGHMDVDAKPNTPSNRLPSFKAMDEWARDYEGVKGELIRSGIELDLAEFDDFELPQVEPEGEREDAGEDDDWLANLQINDDGTPKSTFFNATEIMRHDQRIKRLMAFNELEMRVENEPTRELWNEKDSFRLRRYVGKTYNVDFPEAKIEQAISDRAYQRAFHPVQQYLEGMEWDGQSRVERLFIDYLGCEDNAYTREAALCWCIAAVTRAFEPGAKFDYVPVLSGQQGIGKSTFIEVMARGWYGELTSFDAKVAAEDMLGNWIMELNEMQATNRHDLEQQKAFLSGRSTTVRMAYGRHPTEFKRQCVFMATTNQEEYLKDSTGNRRWWPIVSPIEKGGVIDLEGLRANADQMWAEAYALYQMGTGMLLSSEAQVIASNMQNEKLESDSWEGVISEWLLKRVDKWRYEPEEMAEDLELRERVCVMEIWQDCLKQNGSPTRLESNRITGIMDKRPGWQRAKNPLRFGSRFGRQKGWICEPDPF